MSFTNQTDKENFIRLRVRDITAPNEEFERELYDKKKKKILPFTYFSPKQFDELVKAKEEDEENPINVKVLGNVKVYKDKYKDIKEGQEYEDFVEEKHKKKIYGSVKVKYTKEYIKKHQKKLKGETCKKFDLYEAKNCRCYGYAEVGENEYVRLVKRNPLFIILIFFLCLGLLVGVGAFKDELPDLPDIFDIEDGFDWNGEQNKGDNSQIIAETYEIPYVPYVVLTEDEPILYLANPKGNTVYFMYSLYIDTNGNGKIEENEAVDKNGKSKAFYQTKLIEPGKMVKADIYSVLGKGEYKVVQKISAYNYAPGEADNQSPCNGSNLTTKIVIK